MTKGVMIVGAAGQDGMLLSQLLEGRGCNIERIVRGDVDLNDWVAVRNRVASVQPDEIYFLAANHHSSEDIPDEDGPLFRDSMRLHFDAAVNFLEAIRASAPHCRFFYASSSHVFEPAERGTQTEATPVAPNGVYGITKAAGMMACRRYREAKGVFASVGILYNHESPLRSQRFVTSKIATAAARIAAGQDGRLSLDDLDARVDWGYAGDFVEAMTRILEADEPGDFIVATGETHTIREFAALAFEAVGLDYIDHVVERPSIVARDRRFRAGDSTKLRELTGWAPRTSFRDLVTMMVIAAQRTVVAGDRQVGA